MFFQEIPVVPRKFVVVAVCVVVALLRPTKFVAAEDHRRTDGEQERGKEILDLSIPRLFDERDVRRAFDAVIRRIVFVESVEILFAVGLVVLLVEGNEVVHGKAVVRRDEVDRMKRALAVL